MSRPRVYETPPIGTTPWPGLLPLRDLDPNDEEDRRAVAYTCGKFLVEQGGPSVAAEDTSQVLAGDCTYRGSNGTMCAWGAFIPDASYDEGMEGQGVDGVLGKQGLPFEWWPMQVLQHVHDVASSAGGSPWSARLLVVIARLLSESEGSDRHRERIILRAMRDGVLDAVLASPEPIPSTPSADGVPR